jgi:hypothetical protein
MDLTTREYQMAKTKSYLKKNEICFFFQNRTGKASDWLLTEQKVASLNLNYYRLNTRSAQKVLKSSKHRFKEPLISSTTSVLTQTKLAIHFHKFAFNKISMAFLFLAIKVNNCIYSTGQLKSLFVFHYRFKQLAMYNFLLANIKNRNV